MGRSRIPVDHKDRLAVPLEKEIVVARLCLVGIMALFSINGRHSTAPMAKCSIENPEM